MRARRIVFPLLAAASVALSCSAGFGTGPTGRRLLVTLVGGDRGAPDRPLPLSFTDARIVTVRVEAQRADGALDAAFNGVVRLTAKPGSLQPIPGRSQRNVQLTGGVAENVEVAIVAAYGPTRIWAEDEGNVPVDPLRSPPPACSNGVDDDRDGNVDYPLDPGCASPIDDTEAGGTFATGTSEPLFFVRPRVADVRGDASGGAKTPFSSEQVDVDTGYRPDRNDFEFDTVVTRIASDGFYVTDLKDPRAYRSVYSFTFNSPQRMRVCDRLRTLTGTATEFFGMTQLASPTFTVEFWNPNKRPCLVPEPNVLSLDEIANTAVLFGNEAALVRVRAEGDRTLHVAGFLGAGYPVQGPDGTFAFTREASNCDLNRNGRVDFGAGTPEQACSDACAAEAECSEWGNYRDQRNFMVVLEAPGANGAKRRGKIQVDASAAPAFDALGARGQPLGAFTGTLKYFSGGSQFTIEARCDDDVAPAGQNPLPSDIACVDPRSDVDNEAQQ